MTDDMTRNIGTVSRSLKDDYNKILHDFDIFEKIRNSFDHSSRFVNYSHVNHLLGSNHWYYSRGNGNEFNSSPFFTNCYARNDS
jgi:hypothetical protein